MMLPSLLDDLQNGTSVFSSSTDSEGTVLLYDMVKNKTARVLRHGAPITSARYTDADTCINLVTVGTDKTLKVGVMFVH